jgi:hypothetical protein
MTQRIGHAVILEKEELQQCDDCGKVAELRPYGPGGSKVCFECGMKDEEGAKQRFLRGLS